MDLKIILKNFNPEFYSYDTANDAPLGRGSFGKVYKATIREEFKSSGLPSEAALKHQTWRVPGSGYEETERNLIDFVGLNFQNTNLVSIFAISTKESRGWKTQHIFMELCHESLYDYTKDQPDFSLPELQHVAHGVLSGLVHLHGMSIIHRDLKPANVLLKKTGESRKLLDMVIKLGDYNICKYSPEEDRTPTQSSFRTSARYRAPELLVMGMEGTLLHLL